MLKAFNPPPRLEGNGLGIEISAGGFYVVISGKSLSAASRKFKWVWRLSAFPRELGQLSTQLEKPGWPKYAYFNDPANDLFYLELNQAEQLAHYLVTLHTRDDSGEDRAVSVLLRDEEFHNFYSVFVDYWMS